MAVVDRKFAVEAAYQIPGWCWPVELGFLYDLAARSRFHIEIGCYCGKSLFPFVCGMPESSRALCIDPLVIVGCDSGMPSNEWITAVLNATISELRRLRPSCSIKHVREHSLAASRNLREYIGQVDTIYIDGEHYYAEVTRDIDFWLPYIRPGGVLCGHDFWPNHPGVMDAVHNRFGDAFKLIDNTRIWSYEVPS